MHYLPNLLTYVHFLLQPDGLDTLLHSSDKYKNKH